jgi:hypothetical protein
MMILLKVNMHYLAATAQIIDASRYYRISVIVPFLILMVPSSNSALT